MTVLDAICRDNVFLGTEIYFLLTLHFFTAPQADAMVRRSTTIVIQNHVVAEAEVVIVIAGGKSDEVEVMTVTVHDDEAKNVGVTNEGATTAGTETEGENEAEARTGEAETKTENDAAEVAIETERGDEVLIVMNLEEQVTETRKEAERRTGHAADERHCKTVKILLLRRPTVSNVQSLTVSRAYFYTCVLTLLKIVKRMLDCCKFVSDLLFIFTLFLSTRQWILLAK